MTFSIKWFSNLTSSKEPGKPMIHNILYLLSGSSYALYVLTFLDSKALNAYYI